MRALLTTSQSLLLLDSDTGAADVIDRGRGLYYGIARQGDLLYVAARRRLVSSTVPQTEERGEILMFDRTLRAAGSLTAPFPLRDLHEIAWHDGKLYATCSFDNMIAVYDGTRWERWFPLGDEHAGDANHFNSFMFEAGRIWILAHNRGPSELMAFSLTDRRLLERVELGNCAHNIWREEGQLMTCSSAHGTLLGTRGFQIETGGFPRGVAFDASHRLVGVSELAERAQRDMSSGRVLVRARDWTPSHAISLEGEGLVLDLLPLPAGFAPYQPGWFARLLGKRAPARQQFGLSR
ncbi:MAG: YncE family protein [Gammaproteobacteria bacterium]